MHKIPLVSFWIGRLMYKELIKVIIRQAGLYNKTGDATKGERVAQFYFTKTFRNQLLSRIRVLYHQYLITNHSESILKSKIMSILMSIFVVLFFLSDLLRNILKCNCSPYSTLMTMFCFVFVCLIRFFTSHKHSFS